MSNDLILQYQKSPAPELERQLLNEYRPYIQASAKKWRGILPDAVVDSHANRFAVEAFKTYKPGGATINTHLASKLQQLGRLNYEHSNVVKIPEHQIMRLGDLKQTQDYLTDVYDREPTHEELARAMKMPKAHIRRMLANSRADLINDSDSEQIGVLKSNYEKSNLLAGYRQQLNETEQKQFDHITGFGGVTPLKPSEFGKKYGLKPYQVSKLKQRFAAGLG